MSTLQALGEHSLTPLQLPNSRPQRGVEMTWNMKSQTWIERQVTFYCADQPFAEGAMRKAYYIKFERNDRARGGDRMCECAWHSQPLHAFVFPILSHSFPYLSLRRFVAKLSKDQKLMYNVDLYERDVKMQVTSLLRLPLHPPSL